MDNATTSGDSNLLPLIYSATLNNSMLNTLYKIRTELIISNIIAFGLSDSTIKISHSNGFVLLSESSLNISTSSIAFYAQKSLLYQLI